MCELLLQTQFSGEASKLPHTHHVCQEGAAEQGIPWPFSSAPTRSPRRAKSFGKLGGVQRPGGTGLFFYGFSGLT